MFAELSFRSIKRRPKDLISEKITPQLLSFQQFQVFELIQLKKGVIWDSFSDQRHLATFIFLALGARYFYDIT